jgi:prolipoprotein diacylglyceryltransferase
MNISSYIIWDVSPYIFTIGAIVVRWYSLLFALTFYIGYNIMQKIFTNEKKTESDV